MKKIFIHIFALGFLISLNACNKLNLAPEDTFGSGNFWKSAAQVDGAMMGLHSDFRNNQSNFLFLGEKRGPGFRTGTSTTGTAAITSASVINQDIRESNPGISGWVGMYYYIFQVNNFIYNVEQSTFLADADKAYYLGQAYGLRAYYYFQLYRTYGRVPIITLPKTAISTPKNAQEGYLPRAKTQKETLDFIKSDVEKSVASFGSDFTNKGTKSLWSLAASLMLKAEVYLWSAKVKIDGQAPTTTAEDLTTARTALELVIPKYTLQPAYANTFSYGNKGNQEIIMAIRYVQGESSNGISQYLYQQGDGLAAYVNATGGSLVPNRYQSDASKTGDPLNLLASGGGLFTEYKFSMFQQYETGDSRAQGTFFDAYKRVNGVNTVSFVMFTKFLGTVVNNARSYSDDYPIYRLADAILMLAEVKNKQGQDPSAEINQIRTRAYGTTAFTAYTNGTFEQNELAIFAERRKEFVSEGKIWYDLRRMQDASGDPLAFRKDLPLVGVLNKATEEYKLIWPIDRGTLNADPTLEQNPSYTGT